MGLSSNLIKNTGLKIDLEIDLPLCPLPNRLIFQIQESCDLQGRPLGQNPTVRTSRDFDRKAYLLGGTSMSFGPNKCSIALGK